jgi:hypothetical protein
MKASQGTSSTEAQIGQNPIFLFLQQIIPFVTAPVYTYDFIGLLNLQGNNT